jgi:two-component system NtrC family sensor kinase
MNIAEKTKEQLTGELEALRLRIAKLKRVETERKQTEEAFQAEKNKLQSVVDALEYGLTIQDKDYNIIYQNEPSKALFGDRLGEKCYRVYGGEKKVCDDCPVEMAFGDGESHTLEKRKVMPWGEVIFWENTASPIRDAKGNIVSCLEVARNVTERKQVEEALQAGKNKLESVINAMEDGLTIQDKDYNIIYQNKLVRELFGDRLGEKCYRVYEGQEKLCDGCPVKKAFRDGQSHTSERRVVLPSGEVTFWENTANPVRDAEGKIVSCLEITRNITERKRAEEALQKSQEKLRQMFESVTDGISVIDLNGVITEVNQRTVEMHGFSSKDELLGKSALELIAPRDHERIAANMRKALKEGTVKGVEYTLLRADGSEFLGELSTSVLKDAAGNWVGHITISRDITKRKRAEEALLEAEEKYKNFVEATSDLVWEADGMGMYTFASPRIKDILGYEVNEVVGKKRTLDFAPEEEKRKWLGRFKEINAKRVPFFGFEITHLRKNGTPVVFEVSGAPFADSAGNFKGFVGINKDITERKQAEEARREAVEALRESQEFSSSLLENSPNPICVVNPDTSVKYVNPAFEKLTGFTLAEITGREAPYPWWLKEQWKEMAPSFKNAMVTGGRKSEKVFQKKDGERFFVVLNSAPIVHEGKLLYFLISWLDITERKRAEEERSELEQKAHLASRLASVGEMASGIAHEINNPLTAVIGFAQLLMDTDLPEEVKEDIGVIHKEAQRAAGVARNLLTFARKHIPTKQPTNLNTIIDGVLKLRAYEQSVSNIKVNTRFAPSLPEVMADYSQMQQVFINIILNAESAMLESGNGGTLNITTRKVDNLVRASFTDSGPGIAKENLNRIFDPFFTTKEVGKGTGLGLSVCHGIVAEHGGRIYARSKLGKGATFIVELPINAR